MANCEEVKGIIRQEGFKVRGENEMGGSCIVDFKAPKVKVGKPVSYFLSSASWDGKSIDTTVRNKIGGYKEFYFEYCCEKDGKECVNMCRPHFNPENDMVSVEATFDENPLGKFKRLLQEIK